MLGNAFRWLAFVGQALNASEETMTYANILPEKGERNLICKYHCIPGGACFSVVSGGRPLIEK